MLAMQNSLLMYFGIENYFCLFVASHFASRQRISNLSGSEMTLDEIAGDSDSIDSETFLPAEMVFSKLSDPVLPVISVAKVDVATMTDVAESPFKLPGAPCTPIPVLRERVTSLRMTLLKKEKENEDLREELEDLTNFTRLEQQIGVHAQATAKHVDSPVMICLLLRNACSKSIVKIY